MTLSATRPVPDAISPTQQRLEVELLLGERVLRSQELEQADPKAFEACPSINSEQWRSLGCLPIRRISNRIVAAVPTFWGLEQRRELMETISGDGLEPDLRLGLKDEIEVVLRARLEELAAAVAQGDEGSSDALSNPDEEQDDSQQEARVERISLLEDLSLEPQLDEAPPEDDAFMNLEEGIAASSASPVVSLVNRILIKAIDTDSSDVHVEPQEEGLQIRFRQDGVLQPLELLPRSLIPAITSRLKIMADLDISERRMPQDGRIRRVFKGRTIELRVSTLPSRWGRRW